LGSFIVKAGNILVNKKAEAIVDLKTARDNCPPATDAGHVVADFNAFARCSGHCNSVRHLGLFE